jgi:hypothetical protein
MAVTISHAYCIYAYPRYEEWGVGGGGGRGGEGGGGKCRKGIKQYVSICTDAENTE